MSRVPVKLTFVTILFLAIAVYVSAEKGNAFYEFLEDPINARSIGMGSVGTALPNNAGFTFYNPALPAINKTPYLTFNYGRQYEDLWRANPEFSWVSPSWFLGIAFLTQSSGTFQMTNEQGIIEGATGSEQSSIGSLNAGYRKDYYSLGISINGIQNKIADYTSYGVTGNAGAIFNLIPEKLYAGLAVFNIGRNSSFLDTNHHLKSDQLPMTIRAGVSWSDTLKVKFPFTVAFDIVYSKNYEKVMIPVGLEFWVHPAFAVRVGKRFNFENDLFSLGTGLRFENLGFDAAFTPTRTESDFGLKWSMGINYYLASIKKKDEKEHKQVSDPAKSEKKVDSVSTNKADSVPVFKAPVELKLNKKKMVDTINVSVDSLKSLNSDTTISVDTIINSIPQKDSTSLESATQSFGTEGATSNSSSNSDSTNVIRKPESAITPILEEDGELQ